MNPPFEFSPRLWRGPQPTPEQWHALWNAGVRFVVKLNTEAEGSDDLAEEMGMRVFRLPLPKWEQVLPNRWVGPAIQGGLSAVEAFQVSAPGEGVLVHCLHGEDRTGILVALIRLQLQQWCKPDAEKEMLANGFHKMLLGLWEFWEDI